MLKRYPDSFRLDVYKTHRTASAPQYIYDNTATNAVNGSLQNGIPAGVKAGTPFPIPSGGEEAMWNHTLRWRGTDVRSSLQGVQVTGDGRLVVTAEGTLDMQFPYNLKEPNASTKAGEYWLVRNFNSGPPIRAGEAIVGRQNMDEDRTQTWVYLTGQRRVRKLPISCCDTPTPATAGVMSFDELGIFTGRMDRFDWKLVGKQEMYVPYNSNRSMVPRKATDLIGPKHLNPDFVRWELHRVWVVEATLRAGQRHTVPRARYYLDEDTWMGLLADRWDARGQLWKTLWTLPFAAPDVPAVFGGTYGFYDLLEGGYFANDVLNEQETQYRTMPPFKDSVFTPEALAGEGLRCAGAQTS